MTEQHGDLPCRSKALADLREHWQQAYRFSVRDMDHGEEWTASRRGDGTILVAESAAQLRALVRADYTRPPLP
jgi:hypothetical protein